MHLSAIDGIALEPPEPPRAFWRRALSGLTMQTVAIVAALLFVRALTTEVERAAAGHYDVGAWLRSLPVDYTVLLLQGVPMLVIIIATSNLGPQRGRRRVAALATSVVLSACVGAVLRLAWLDHWHSAFDILSYVLPRYAVLGAMLTIVGELYRKEVASTRAAQRAELDHAAFEAEMSEARLQVLQAQIEPHFLFNTLANARRLYAEDHALGRTMLESLMRYLEIALPQIRQAESTLKRDAELIEAFLTIQRIRMGQRVAFSINIPADLGTHLVPPMMLLTLVENAVKHGISPSPNGGLIRVVARADGDRLMLTVADTGTGFASGSGTGIGLANISARLATQFGDKASLTLENNEFGGATATIVLPLSTKEPDENEARRHRPRGSGTMSNRQSLT